MSKRKTSMPRGRPPLPPDELRANRVVTFFTDPELATLRQLSREESKTLSATCHRIITRYLDRHPSQPEGQGRSDSAYGTLP